MQKKEFESIRKELLMEMKFMDTTINGINDTEEYKSSCSYNAGIRTAVDILKKHSSDEAFQTEREMCEAAEKKFREGCYDMIESFHSPEEMLKILFEEYEKFTCAKADTSLNMNVINAATRLKTLFQTK